MKLLYFRSLAERAVKTFAQALVAVLGAGAADLLSVGWTQALSVAGFAALLSVLTSVASAPWGDSDTPSLIRDDRESV